MAPPRTMVMVVMVGLLVCWLVGWLAGGGGSGGMNVYASMH
jgi:hypothetical protein